MKPGTRSCVLFVLAFGKPRPFHRAAIYNWSHVTTAHFVLITDEPELWAQVCTVAENVSIVPISIDDYFASFYPLFDVIDKRAFLAEFGHAFFNAVNGWTACGFRPLLRHLLDVSEYPEPVWGWMDYDVLLDSARFDRWIAACRSGAVEGWFFSREGIVWEQLKVFRNEYNIFQCYESVLLTDPMLVPVPMEARVSQFIRNQQVVTFEDFPHEELCAHWKFSDELAQELPNRYEVCALGPARLVQAATDRPVAVFIADTECKEFTEVETDKVMRAWQEGRPFSFPHRKRRR